jgi:hypothetical protein
MYLSQSLSESSHLLGDSVLLLSIVGSLLTEGLELCDLLWGERSS